MPNWKAESRDRVNQATWIRHKWEATMKNIKLIPVNERALMVDFDLIAKHLNSMIETGISDRHPVPRLFTDIIDVRDQAVNHAAEFIGFKNAARVWESALFNPKD